MLSATFTSHCMSVDLRRYFYLTFLSIIRCQLIQYIERLAVDVLDFQDRDEFYLLIKEGGGVAASFWRRKDQNGIGINKENPR